MCTEENKVAEVFQKADMCRLKCLKPFSKLIFNPKMSKHAKKAHFSSVYFDQNISVNDMK